MDQDTPRRGGLILPIWHIYDSYATLLIENVVY
jgi:hypothetical protein